MKTYLLKNSITFSFVFLFVIIGNAQVTSNFDYDLEGWVAEGDNYYYYETGQGNPGNCLRINDYATGQVNFAIAPGKFLGDWSAATELDSVYFDLYLGNPTGSYDGGYQFEIEGPQGRAVYFRDYEPLPDQWNYYSAKLDSTLWVITAGTWSSLLNQVWLMRVRGEYIVGSEFDRLDNISLSFTPPSIPITPTVQTDFEDGTPDGWHFLNTGGITIESSGGNPGKCCRISDSGNGRSYAIAPPKFLGDWSLIDNAAYLQFDLHISSGTTWLPDFYVKISGPGGVAVIPGDGSYTSTFNQWETYSYFLAEPEWTVTSGDWSSIITQVDEIRINAEFISGGETVYIDNIRITDHKPVANFNANPVYICPGGTVQFTDRSVYAPENWLWDFGDGGSSTDENPAYIYNNSGVYDVRLIATNFFGSDTLVLEDYIEVQSLTDSVLFYDDFNDGVFHPGWSFTNGSWYEQSGYMRQSDNYGGGTHMDAVYALTGCEMWENYAINVDMMSSDNDNIGIMFNYQDNQNAYIFVWNRQGNWRSIVKVENGSEYSLVSDNVPYSEDVWYQINIQFVDGQIDLSIDGNPVFSVFDPDYITGGKAGLYARYNAPSYWDNFEVINNNNYKYLDLKVFLEGPFNGSDMNADLTGLTDFPLSQPYNVAPWNYSGTESVSVIPNGNVVDWVLVELRDAADAPSATTGTILAQQAAFVLNDGSIVGLDGNSYLRFIGTITQQLFVVTWHRNHLGVLSANPPDETAGAFTYDFTSGPDQAYGTNALKNLGGGIYGMYAGDGDANGTIEVADKNNIWSLQAGKKGYWSGDFNMDGQVNNPDKNDIWVPNEGEGSQVPE